MADTKKIVHCFEDFGLEQLTVNVLKRKEPSLNLVALRDIVIHTRELVEATFSPYMAEYIGVEQIGNSDTVIWAPNPLDQNWFQRLSEEGHAGKRIVITTTQDAKKEFEPFATTNAIEIPRKNLAETVLQELKK